MKRLPNKLPDRIQFDKFDLIPKKKKKPNYPYPVRDGDLAITVRKDVLNSLQLLQCSFSENVSSAQQQLERQIEH